MLVVVAMIKAVLKNDVVCLFSADILPKGESPVQWVGLLSHVDRILSYHVTRGIALKSDLLSAIFPYK